MSDNPSNNLADNIIRQIEKEENPNLRAHEDQWGVDVNGFPWPNPVTTDAIVAGIIFGHNKEDMFKICDDLFFDRRKTIQNRYTLLAVCGKPKIVVWANDDPELQDIEKLWAQIKKVVNSDWPVIWVKLKEIIPEYSRDYIRVKDGVLWDREDSDLTIG